ncbi:MAG: dihydropteroate synthase [Armatimonadota bacterium]|nr:dihydropteroate synthase [Armatimonadota bacterium]
MLIVGELINSTRPRIRPLLEARRASAIVELARRQIAAGANLVDVNCAALMDDEEECLAWAIETIQGALDVQISIDSPNPAALRRGLQVHRGRALLNSVTLERARWTGLLPLIQEFHCGVIALCMDDQGVPATPDRRLALAGRLVGGLTQANVSEDDIYVDPLVLPVATDTRSAVEVLRAVDLIRQHFPQVHVLCGLSNVSFGLPRRAQVNRVFLVMCMAHGVDAFILDPLHGRLMADLITARMLLGQDESCRGYLSAVRAGRIDDLRNG